MTGVLVARTNGAVIYTTFKEDEALRYANFARSLVENTVSELQILHPNNSSGELAMLRIRAIKNEIMIAREKDYLLVAAQTPPNLAS